MCMDYSRKLKDKDIKLVCENSVCLYEYYFKASRRQKTWGYNDDIYNEIDVDKLFVADNPAIECLWLNSICLTSNSAIRTIYL